MILKLLYFKEIIQSPEALYPWTVWGPLLIFWNSVPGYCFDVSSVTLDQGGCLTSQTPRTLSVSVAPGKGRTDPRVRMEELSFLFPPLLSACV